MVLAPARVSEPHVEPTVVSQDDPAGDGDLAFQLSSQPTSSHSQLTADLPVNILQVTAPTPKLHQQSQLISSPKEKTANYMREEMRLIKPWWYSQEKQPNMTLTQRSETVCLQHCSLITTTLQRAHTSVMPQT